MNALVVELADYMEKHEPGTVNPHWWLFSVYGLSANSTKLSTNYSRRKVIVGHVFIVQELCELLVASLWQSPSQALFNCNETADKDKIAFDFHHESEFE